MSVERRVIVITGASSGFGELIARRCVADGATVVLAARSADKLAALAAELGTTRALAIPTDVSRQDDVNRLARSVIEQFGRLDVLVNNAGFGVLDRFVDARIDDLQAMIDVNLYGAVRCTQAFLPHMLAQRRGQIMMVASVAGLISSQNMSFYSATKAALVGMTRSLMLELHGTGVHCALLMPGVAPTGFQSISGHDKYARSTRLSACTADEVAAAALRAIERNTHGEIVIPWRIRPLTSLAGIFPSLTRVVMHILR